MSDEKLKLENARLRARIIELEASNTQLQLDAAREEMIRSWQEDQLRDSRAETAQLRMEIQRKEQGDE